MVAGMRYAAAHKPDSEPLNQFVQRKGGINACVARFSRRLGRGAAKRHKRKRMAECGAAQRCSRLHEILLRS
jgi:hypothetical protein